MVIAIAPGLAIDEAELHETFIRASGPGGQNVNKVSSAVQLRFDLAASALPEAVKHRAAKLAGQRLTLEGWIVITAQTHRSQPRNREEAREKLLALLREAAIPPVRRRPTRPTHGSQLRRLTAKKQRGATKAGRRPTDDE